MQTKLSFIRKVLGMRPRFQTEAQGNTEMAYCLYDDELQL